MNTNPLRRRWRTDFDLTSKAIPESWLVRDGDFTGIAPEHHDEDLVRVYRGLLRVGYAKGWL